MGLPPGRHVCFMRIPPAEARLLGGGWISRALSRAEQREQADGEAARARTEW